MSALARFKQTVEAARQAERSPRGEAPQAEAAAADAPGPASPELQTALVSRPAPAPPSADHAEIERRRDRVARALADAHWDLGGIAYEMAARDHFRLDVLQKQAAKVQELDAELGTLEYLLRLEQAGAAGECGNCGTFYARGAAFCARCGDQLLEAGDPAP